MSLFVCEKCQAIENTALCNYWLQREKLCSACDPEIGKWHNSFPKEEFNPDKHELYGGGFVRLKGQDRGD